MPTVSEVLASTLRDAGVDTVFGLPGGENAEVLDALRRSGIDFVLVRNENSAVFMADATARLTGRPGVALATLGPGATNAYCAMAHAYLDRSPVVLVTAQSDRRILGRYTHQVIDLQSSFTPITKMTAELTATDTLRTVEQALRVAVSDRPGPVHLGVSAHMATQEVEPSTAVEAAPGVRASAPVGDLEGAARFLAAAERPVILAGLGLEPEKPYDALRRLAERAQTPVITSPKAKGAIPADHPLSVGTIGLTGADAAYQILEEADCIVAIGFDVVEMESLWEQRQPIIWVAPWTNEDPVLPFMEHEVVGPITPSLDRLAEAEFTPTPGWGGERVRAFRRDLASLHLPEAANGRIQPQSLLAILRKHLPREAVVTTDTGSHKICTALVWPTYEPNTYLLSNGLSTMGIGLPAAIAASRVTGAVSLCITGDGGMAMVLGELGLLRDLNVPVIVVVMNDNALDLIRSGQIRRGKPVYGTEFVNPDYQAVAHAFGLDYFRASDEASATEAIQRAVPSRRPTVIEALIDPASYPTTPAR
ncbi:MAG: thiamine pyrophosphate-binding protein [Actinomycetia bacterium]|nr:thiamine pyrophosphate-binding protein [Actinomycetes bacterium]